MSLRAVPHLGHANSSPRRNKPAWIKKFERKLLVLTGKTMDELWPEALKSQDFLNRPLVVEHTGMIELKRLSLRHEEVVRLEAPEVDPELQATQNERDTAIDQALRTLTYREREIIRMRYGLGDGYPYTYEEIGRVFKLTGGRIQQIECKAIRKLQHHSRSDGLRKFSTGYRDDDPSAVWVIMASSNQQKRSRKMKAIVVTDLSFGDSGKGSIVAALVRKHDSKLVVRATGGCQASHSVVRPDGGYHKFAQWGSGTFAGAATYLDRQMIIDPLAMQVEAACLMGAGITDPYGLLKVHPKCLVSTLVHKFINRNSAASLEYGTCGMGIGATRKYWLDYGEAAITACDLMPSWRPVLISKLNLLLQRTELDREFSAYELADRLLRSADQLQGSIRGYDFPEDFPGYIPDGTVIFEGAQGVLIDQRYGCYPHTTWSDVTNKPAMDLIASRPQFTSVHNIGVIRAYMTRHGNGPLPTEMTGPDFIELIDSNNPYNEYQGDMRFGWPDLALLKYALKYSPCASLAVNHVDQVEDKTLHVRTVVDSPVDLWDVTKAQRMLPSQWTALPWIEIMDTIDDMCPISIVGRGPKASDKTFLEK